MPSGSRVTPGGVRDGDPVALAAVCERRGPAVLAYCELVSAPGRATEAATEAFRGFRATVWETERLTELDPETLLLAQTRAAAAARAPGPPAQMGRRLGARRPAHSPCELVPELLVARAEGRLGSADELRLSRHLERCEACRLAGQRFKAAEHAYRDPPSDHLPADAAEAILAALTAAAPVAAAATNGGAAPPPPDVIEDEAHQTASEVEAAPAPSEYEPEPPPAPVVGEPPPPLDGDTTVLPAASVALHPDPEPGAPIVIGGAPEARGQVPVAGASEDVAAAPPVGTGLLGSLTTPGRRLPRARRTPNARQTVGSPAWARLGLPAAIVAVALLVTLAVAGVFSTGSGTRAGHRSAVGAGGSPILPAPVPNAPAGPPASAASPKPARVSHRPHRRRRPAATTHRAATRHRVAPRRPGTRRSTTRRRRATTSPPTPSRVTAPTPTPSSSRPSRQPPSAHVAPGTSKAPPPSGPPASGPGYQPGG